MANGYATCATHIEDAINWAVGRKLPIRVRSLDNDPLFSCHCRKPASYYLFEVSPEAAMPRDVLDMS